MHEWAMACELVRQAETEARGRGALAVVAVTVRAGRLTGVVPELLSRAYEMARTGSLLAEAPLTVEVAPARARCPSCGAESEFDDFALVCPSCGAIGLTVVSGDKIVLTRLELEMADEAGAAEGGGHV